MKFNLLILKKKFMEEKTNFIKPLHFNFYDFIYLLYVVAFFDNFKLYLW